VRARWRANHKRQFSNAKEYKNRSFKVGAIFAVDYNLRFFWDLKGWRLGFAPWRLGVRLFTE
jgi:hypothetical protein